MIKEVVSQIENGRVFVYVCKCVCVHLKQIGVKAVATMPAGVIIFFTLQRQNSEVTKLKIIKKLCV